MRHFPVSHKSICPGRSASPLDKHIGFKLSARQQLQRPRREQTGMWHGMTIKDAFFCCHFCLCRCRRYKLQLAARCQLAASTLVCKASRAKLRGAPSGQGTGSACCGVFHWQPNAHCMLEALSLDNMGSPRLQEKPPATLFLCGLDYC